MFHLCRKVYDEIANHFSETRHSPWPKVKDFIESFGNGSIVVDIGCGNGKYLSLNDSILKVSMIEKKKRILDSDRGSYLF